MTEHEWLGSDDPQMLLGMLGSRATPRKLQLFACACLRLAWPWTDHRHFRRAVLVGERFADGHLSVAEMRAAFRMAWPSGWEPVRSAAVALLAADSDWQLYGARGLAAEVVALTKRCAPLACTQVPTAQARIIRELFGNPFQPVGLAGAWLTPDVLTLATAIHDEDLFDTLPVLADALEEAGCMDSVLLGHCRAREPHVRGCWVVDLALGRK